MKSHTRTNDDQRNAAARATARRHLSGIAGVMVGSCLLIGVTLLFDSASRMPWLTPTENNVALIARCDRIASPRARDQCVEAVVAAVLARGAEPKLAAASPASQAVR